MLWRAFEQPTTEADLKNNEKNVKINKFINSKF